MPVMSFVGTWQGAGSAGIEQISDLDVCLTENGPVIYASSRIDQSITSFSLATGTATQGAQTHLPAGLSQPGDFSLEVIELEGTMQAVSLSGNGAGLPSYELDSNGALATATDYLSATGLGTQVAALSAVTIGGEDYLYVAESGDTAGALQYYRMDSTGVLRPGVSGGAQTITATGITAMTTHTAGGQEYLFAVSAHDHQIYGYQLTSSGGLRLSASVGATQGLGLNTPTAVDVLTAGGVDYLVVAAAGTSSLTVLRIGTGGSLTPTDHVIDDLTTRFQAVTSIDTVNHNGRAYVVAGGGDDGVSVFELLPGGRLLHLDTVPDGLNTALQNVSALRMVSAGGQLQILAGSETEAGLTQLRMDPGNGQVLTAGNSGGALTGGTGNDLLTEGEGDDRLDGGAGNDTLVGGTGQDQLTGGSGADLFVVLADGQTDTIRDFQPGTDRIDLSFWPMLRSAAQLTFTTTSNGGTISFFGQTLQIRTANGSPLSPLQMQLALNDSFLHIPVGEVSSGRILTGTGGADVLTGGSDDDEIDGRGGQDTLSGHGGDDTITGGGGQDEISGGAGADTINGGRGADQVNGGDGDDVINGQGGRDTLDGGKGRDQIFGSDGSDTINGGEDADTLNGGDGNDRVDGGKGSDTVSGDKGADRVYGRDGNDILSGGSGDDQLRGGTGDDQLNGNGDDDRLAGNAGRDQLSGGPGNDVLSGGSGQDVLHGGTGNDVLTGGKARDTFIFSAGRDTIRDFSGDRLHLDDALWSGTLTKAQVISRFAAVEGDDLVFSFGGGNTLTLEDYTDINDLAPLLTLI